MSQLTKAKIRPSYFGDNVPFGDPSWYQGAPSPFYNRSHKEFRKKCRDFMEEHVMPFVLEWEENYQIPKELFVKVGTDLEGYEDILPKDFDFFHVVIANDELTRCGAGGVPWGISGGLTIGLPPILFFGSDYLKEKVVDKCIKGEKIICLAISEPQGGSDVAGIKTTARKEGDHYIINGEKKWITNGTYADYFTVACRTGPEGARGNVLSMFLIEREMEGVSTRHMKCQGVWSSGTAYIEFDNVKVPKENLIGKENEGFKQIMYNFNNERFSLSVMANRLSRVCYEESFKYAHIRETFGKKLIQHQAIRMKLADMSRLIESTHAWLESITYQFCQLSRNESISKMGEICALLKVQTTKVLELCAREAVHTFGGSGYVRGGVGEKVERIYRDVRAFSIPGGAEEILSDYAIRSFSRKYSKL